MLIINHISISRFAFLQVAMFMELVEQLMVNDSFETFMIFMISVSFVNHRIFISENNVKNKYRYRYLTKSTFL